VIAVGEADQVPQQATPLPASLPVLPLRDSVTFPDTLTPLAIGQERSIALVNDVLAGDRMLVMLASRDPEVQEPGPAGLYDVGVAGTVARPSGRASAASVRSTSSESPGSGPQSTSRPPTIQNASKRCLTG